MHKNFANKLHLQTVLMYTTTTKNKTFIFNDSLIIINLHEEFTYFIDSTYYNNVYLFYLQFKLSNYNYLHEINHYYYYFI